MKRYFVLPGILTSLVAAPAARAGLLLSLSSATPDLLHLHVGQTVTFEVILSGPSPGDALDYLAGTAVFDAAPGHLPR
jgi:hypothetical protein